MALTAGSQIATASPFSTRVKAINSRSVSFVSQKRTYPSKLRLNISCLAKPETVEKVAGVVRKQLAIPDEKPITGESTFADLGADSLDTVEIMMGLEEAFEISVDEGKAEGISTVHQAADMIEKICKN